MASITIPDSALPAIRSVLQMSNEHFREFVEALSKAEPALQETRFWTHVVPLAKSVNSQDIRNILEEVFVMDATRDRMGVDVPRFAELVAEATPEGVVSSAQEKKLLQERIAQVLQGRKGISTTAKASGIALDHSHVFYSAKILSDIRPVFDESGDSVDGAVIIHNLCIHYGEGSEHKDFYVALDTSDVEQLFGVLERATKKTDVLRRVLESTGVSYLDPEE